MRQKSVPRCGIPEIGFVGPLKQGERPLVTRNWICGPTGGPVIP
jgi:hypothetical protein